MNDNPSPLFTLRVPAQPKPTQRARSGKAGHHFTPQPTRNHMAYIKALAVQKLQATPDNSSTALLPYSGPVKLTVVAEMAIPPSWPAWKRQAALEMRILPAGKPDWDNLGKMVSDALNGVVYLDDAQVVLCETAKRYSDSPCTLVMLFAARALSPTASKKEFDLWMQSQKLD